MTSQPPRPRRCSGCRSRCSTSRPVSSDRSPVEALADSTALVQEAERLGYHRLWYAEHHNMPGIASSAPAVLIAHAGGAHQRASGSARAA